ncbi:cation transporting ATPase C-terminal domain-containing protein [Pantoea sp. AS142]|uniref:cation transporting ATPase C-terminal domain-containing protein n=1 Tax=Pantoea sp. AS142 TaxID=3081292 RepID=UPI00301A8714
MTLLRIVLKAIIVYILLINTLLGTHPLPINYWLISLIVSMAIFRVVEIENALPAPGK